MIPGSTIFLKSQWGWHERWPELITDICCGVAMGKWERESCIAPTAPRISYWTTSGLLLRLFWYFRYKAKFYSNPILFWTFQTTGWIDVVVLGPSKRKYLEVKHYQKTASYDVFIFLDSDFSFSETKDNGREWKSKTGRHLYDSMELCLHNAASNILPYMGTWHIRRKTGCLVEPLILNEEEPSNGPTLDESTVLSVALESQLLSKPQVGNE